MLSNQRLDTGMEYLYYCPEPDGARMRRVVEVQMNDWLRSYLTNQLPLDHSPIKDLDMLYHEAVRVFLVDSVGVLIQGFVEMNGLIDVHVGFWDRRLRGREAMCRSMAANVMSDGGWPGVWTPIPRMSAATLAFAKRVGFVEVGESAGTVVLTMADYIM